MPPEDRFVPRFAAEPPQDLLPYGRWAQTLTEEFLAACLRIDSEGEDLGEPGDVTWYPDRTWHGRTFVPATALTDKGDEVVGGWRGEQGKEAAMTLVWGRPLVDGGAVVTGELADVGVDQCVLVEGRFTLLAPDDYRGDTLDVKLFDRRGQQIALESLYAEDDDGA